MGTADGGSPRIAWLGDDFTGSAAVMEVLTFAGLPSVLFTGIPGPALAARFAGAGGIGIATTARSHGPDWMAAELPPLLRWLDGLGAPLLHYKICSTFDSAPEVGSIGRAMEIALGVRPARAVPLLTAAPAMRRYQVFGHLFAGTANGVFRLDRHPVMAHHPVTPMTESDLLRHLAAQTDLPGALVDLEALAGDPAARVAAAMAGGARILSLDCADAASEAAAGRLLWEGRAEMPLVVGSQGVEYALVRHWQATGLLPPPPPARSAGAADRIAAVSGSVSPVTARQLAWAAAHGFALLPFEAATVCGAPGDLAAEEARLVAAATEAAARGQSPLVHSAAGHDDASVARFRAALSASAIDARDGQPADRRGARPHPRRRPAGHRAPAGGDLGRRHVGPRHAPARARGAGGAGPDDPRRGALPGVRAGPARRARDRAQGRADGVGRLLRLDPGGRRAAVN
jgi:3-oxoisoapionate kinase